MAIVSGPFLAFSDTDELNRLTAYNIDPLGRIFQVKHPLDGYSQFTYDSDTSSRGNLLSTINVAQPGSSLSNVIFTNNYVSTCTNPLTCNNPTSTIDANGNETDYTYDPNTGFVLTKTLPAGPNGVRPHTAYVYEQLSASYYVAAGQMGQGSPIWKLSYSSTCQTKASCSGTSDEVRVTYTYDGNLRPVTVTTAAGDGSLSSTTTNGYDAVGNLISVTKPMGSANTATTTVYIYDAARQKIGEIGPAPTGNGHYRASRTTYDLDGRVILEETGYTTSQAYATLASFVSLEQASSAYDNIGRKIQDAHSGGGVISTLTQYGYDADDRLTCTAVRMNASAFSSLMATTFSGSTSGSGVLPTSACSLGPTGSDGPDRITSNSYDAAGELLQVTTGYSYCVINCVIGGRFWSALCNMDIVGGDLPERRSAFVSGSG